jgi:hypothetical protein
MRHGLIVWGMILVALAALLFRPAPSWADSACGCCGGAGGDNGEYAPEQVVCPPGTPYRMYYRGTGLCLTEPGPMTIRLLSDGREEITGPGLHVWRARGVLYAALPSPG